MSALPWIDPAVWSQRRPERELLLWCLGCVTIGFVLVLGSAAAPTLADLAPLGLYALSLAALHLLLVGGAGRADQALVATVALLAGLGLLAQTRMGAFDGSGPWSPDRLLFPGGLAVMGIAAVLLAGGRYRWLSAAPWLWAALSLGLIGALLAVGQRFRGSVFGLGHTTPTEALKLTTVLFAAGYLERQGRALGRWHPRWPLPPWRPLWPLALFWLLLAGLLAVQRDLGMATILGVALLTLLTSASGHWGYPVYGLVGAAALGGLALGVFAHGARRIDAWLDPFQDPTGDGWQILQGLSGMYSGGLWGEGFGEGRPDYTPIAESDFIYSVIGEELGFLGCALVLLLFLILFQRGLLIAERARQPFGRLLALGIATVLATQTFLHLGGVVKLVPLTGLTLPFVSHGGTSLLTAFAGLGMLLAISAGEPAAARRPQGAPAPAVQKPRTAVRKPRRGRNPPDAAPTARR